MAGVKPAEDNMPTRRVTRTVPRVRPTRSGRRSKDPNAVRYNPPIKPMKNTIKSVIKSGTNKTRVRRNRK